MKSLTRISILFFASMLLLAGKASANIQKDSVKLDIGMDTIIMFDMSKVACRVHTIKENGIIYSIESQKNNIQNFEIFNSRIDHIKFSGGEILYYNPLKGDSTNNLVLKNILIEQGLFFKGYKDYQKNNLQLFHPHVGSVFFVTSLVLGPISIVPAVISASVKPKIRGKYKEAYYPESYKKGLVQAGSEHKKTLIKANVLFGMFYQILGGLIIWGIKSGGK